MRNDYTLDKLSKMRLSGIQEAYEAQLNNKEIQDLSFNERFSLLVDYEYARRQNNKLSRLINQASLVIQKRAWKILNTIQTAI
ncbi:ATP-binding protein [Aerococcus urinaeequi]|uniref:ATP-binding protein n=1 Tax=Aerococcus urinaeequi TaxID=51665 RepID=UPI000845D18A|nr:ATP-binding protein [Aerococcus urinaeequi]